MPSVRVKRGQYAFLDDPDTPLTHPATRPRSRSIAAIYSPPAPATPAQAPDPHGERPRSHTLSGAAAPQVGALRPPPPRTLRRPPSKIHDHILGIQRSPSQRFQRIPDDAKRTRASSSADGGSAVRRSEDDTDVISLSGSNENIVYHGDGGHPGRIGSALSLPENERQALHHHDEIVEHLDVIDPAVATVSTLTNAANAIVIPPLSFYSRKPTIVLPDLPKRSSVAGDAEKGQIHEDNLDRHVEDVLSKRDQFRRIMKGVWAFMKTPMGVLVSIYGFLIVFWGTGIVFFLAKFINLHNDNTQGFWVEVCQQVETGLFTATSIGLIPFRALDTWRIWRIWRWQRITNKRRLKAGLPALYDKDDLPDPLYDENYVHVLTEEEQADLHYQQHKFMDSQTWYRPHGTSTHRAFPISLALWIMVMNDLNSFWQCLLSGTMWGLDRFARPAWTTATTLPFAFICGILAGVFIWWGGKKTRRHEQVEQRLRAALAMEKPGAFATDSAEPKGGAVEPSGTADSTPTLAGQGPPRCKDFVEGEESERRDGEAQRREDRGEKGGLESIYEDVAVVPEDEKASTRRRASASSSVASVPIADHMVVPPAELVHSEPHSS